MDASLSTQPIPIQLKHINNLDTIQLGMNIMPFKAMLLWFYLTPSN